MLDAVTFNLYSGYAQGQASNYDCMKEEYRIYYDTSGSHNTARSAQNVQMLNRIGIYDNSAGRAVLSEHFDEVVSSTSNVARTFTDDFGTYQVRESLLAGPNGFLKLESTWQVTDDGSE